MYDKLVCLYIANRVSVHERPRGSTTKRDAVCASNPCSGGIKEDYLGRSQGDGMSNPPPNYVRIGCALAGNVPYTQKKGEKHFGFLTTLVNVD